MKKLIIAATAGLAFTNMIQISARTWTITNTIEKEVCVTVNASGSIMRKSIAPRKTATFSFNKPGEKGLCLKSISIEEFKEGCPKGLKSFGNTNLAALAANEYKKLKKVVQEATKKPAANKDKLAEQVQEAASKATRFIQKLCKDGDLIITKQEGKIKVFFSK